MCRLLNLEVSTHADVVEGVPWTSAGFRKVFAGNFILAGGYTQNDAIETVGKGDADAIAFGRLYISNLDLAEHFSSDADAELNKYNRATFYGGGAEGYTDYPFSTSKAYIFTRVLLDHQLCIWSLTLN